MIQLHNLFTRLAAPALLLLAVVVVGCSDANGDAEVPPPAAGTTGTASTAVRVETLVVSPGTFDDVVTLTGDVEAVDDATFSAQAAGTVIRLVPLGTHVAAGQPVALLDPGMARAALQQVEAQVASAQAAYALAEEGLKRQRPLYQDSIISDIEFATVRTQYNQAQAALKQAQASVAQAREQLANTRVVSPFGGRVEEHFVDVGEQLTPGRPVARVVNASRVKVRAGVPERYAGDVHVGSPVQLDFKAYSGERRRATVTFVGSTINPDSRTFPIEIELSNPEGRLKPDMVATVLVTRERIDDAIVVPRAAVLRDERGTSVFVVETADTAAVVRRRLVDVGSSNADRVVVHGLQAGDAVVVRGQNSVTDGDAVTVTEQRTAIDAMDEGLSPSEG